MRERLPDGRRAPKRKPKPEPKGCAHASPGWCQPCIDRLTERMAALEKRQQQARWRQQDKSAERFMLQGPGKVMPPMCSATFVAKVRNAGPRFD